MIKKLIKRMARAKGYEKVSLQRLDQLQTMETDIAELFDLFTRKNILEGQSKAQNYQDIFVLLATKFKKNGFFVEFGATNGVDLSNTYLLEKSYGWKGILAEPAKVWHDELYKNRNVSIDLSCVWKVSNDIVNFNMADTAEYSTISEFSDSDHHYKKRKNGVTYDVETISLNDLLKKYDAPKKIDYLSIDTEGSEFEILNNFDFNEYDISIITCEHNYTSSRDEILTLLNGHGYIRRFTGISKWDDWYFRD